MKAKYYYSCFKHCDTEEKLEEQIETCLLDFVKDAENIITTRCAKTREAKASCIKEVNQKWLALIAIHERSKESLSIDHPLKDLCFREDGFKAVFVHTHPEYEWAFDLNSFKNQIEKDQKEREETLKNFQPYKVIPLEELNKHNMHKEFLGICYALGMYNRVGIPLEYLRPLAERASLIKKWIDNDCIIDQEDIKAYEEKWRTK